MQPGSGKAISLFDADPELVRYVDAVHVEAAWSRAVAAVAILRPGDVSPRDWVEVSDGHLGLLVLDGLLTRNVTLLGRTALDLVGSEDLIRPWEDATEHSSVPRSVTWTVHRRTSVAVLDQGFVEELHRFAQPLFGALIQVIAALQVEIVSGQVSGDTSSALGSRASRQLGL